MIKVGLFQRYAVYWGVAETLWFFHHYLILRERFTVMSEHLGVG